MLTEKLSGILESEEALLASILKIAKDKQRALVSNNREGLESCIKEDEKLLPRLKEEETSRIKAVQSIYLIAGKKTDDYSIGTLIDKFSDDLSDEEKVYLENKRESIKELINTITNLNNQNLYLINHSRQFINETINAIINSADRSILDKKV